MKAPEWHPWYGSGVFIVKWSRWFPHLLFWVSKNKLESYLLKTFFSKQIIKNVTVTNTNECKYIATYYVMWIKILLKGLSPLDWRYSKSVRWLSKSLVLCHTEFGASLGLIPTYYQHFYMNSSLWGVPAIQTWWPWSLHSWGDKDLST